MKAKVFFTAALMLALAPLLIAQPDPHHGDRYGNGHGAYHGDHYGDNQHGSYYYTSNRGNRDNYYVRQMNRHDRKRYKKLVRKLRERERCAWDDGYLSRKERRRMRELRHDIDRILQKYERPYRYAYNGSYRRSCR